MTLNDLYGHFTNLQLQMHHLIQLSLMQMGMIVISWTVSGHIA